MKLQPSQTKPVLPGAWHRLSGQVHDPSVVFVVMFVWFPTFPLMSIGVIVMRYVVVGVSPVIVYCVFVVVPFCVPFRLTLYCAIPLLSVLAVHVIVMLVLVDVFARLVGGVGGWYSLFQYLVIVTRSNMFILPSLFTSAFGSKLGFLKFCSTNIRSPKFTSSSPSRSPGPALAKGTSKTNIRTNTFPKPMGGTYMCDDIKN